MKYIIPLFHPTTGRVGVGPQNWDIFQNGFGFFSGNGRFDSVAWNPWWAPRLIGERRKGDGRDGKDRRTASGEKRLRPCRPEENYQRFREGARRSNRRPRGADRRAATGERDFVHLADFTQKVGQNGAVMDDVVGLLVNFFRSLCSGESFEEWRSNMLVPSIFEEQDWSEKDHVEKFTDYAVACCLDSLRPGTVGWRGHSPNIAHMESVSRFERLFLVAPVGSQRKAIRDFFDGRLDLGQLVKMLEPRKLPYPLKALFLVWQHRELKPKVFFERLQDQLKPYGIKLSPKPNSYRKQIQRVKKAAAEFEDRFRELQA